MEQAPQYPPSDPLLDALTPTTSLPLGGTSGAPLYVVLISCVAALGGFLFGFDSGVINGTVTAMAATFGSSSVGTGFSVASMLLGCAVGALIIGPLADRWGRKPMMLVTATMFAVSAGGSGVTNTTSIFIFYRLLGGLGVGAASVLAPAYISEVAPTQWRGRLASLQQLGIVIGLFAAFLSNYLIAGAAGSAGAPFWMGVAAWRWMFWVEVLPAVALFAGALLIPESPRFLVAAGRNDSAERVFHRTSPGSARQKVKEVQQSLDASHRPHVRDLFARGRLRPVVLIGATLSVFQQLVGINVVFYYGEVLWRSVGFTESEALLVNLLSGGVNIASTFVAISFVDRVGRKPLLTWGSLGMALALATVALSLSTGTSTASGSFELSESAGTVALIAANLYVFCFGASWGPVVWVLLGEMFHNQIRGAALSAGAGAQWIANFAVTMSFPILLNSAGVSIAYAFYAACAALSFVFVRKFVKETKGKSLEQM